MNRNALILAATSVILPAMLTAQQDPYATRGSQCRHQRPPGQSIAGARIDTGIKTTGYTAERVITQSADARNLSGGDVVVCTEYGSVEIVDSDDNQVRLQIRVEGFGEGSDNPGAAATQVIDETDLHSFITAHEGKLYVRVWHSTLGFTQPGRQPAWLSVRLQLPPRGAYRIRTEAFHGDVAVRRLTVANAFMRGNVGVKLKGIPGFIGTTELDNVVLAGDVDIDNLIGLPGIRAPVPAQLVRTAAPILIKARAAAHARVTAVTGGNIDIAIQPAPDLGVLALGQSNDGQVRVGVDAGVAGMPPADSTFRTQQLFQSAGFEAKRIRVEVKASSAPGNVNITSVPAAPLKR